MQSRIVSLVSLRTHLHQGDDDGEVVAGPLAGSALKLLYCRKVQTTRVIVTESLPFSELQPIIRISLGWTVKSTIGRHFQYPKSECQGARAEFLAPKINFPWQG